VKAARARTTTVIQRAARACVGVIAEGYLPPPASPHQSGGRAPARRASSAIIPEKILRWAGEKPHQ